MKVHHKVAPDRVDPRGMSLSYSFSATTDTKKAVGMWVRLP